LSEQPEKATRQAQQRSESYHPDFELWYGGQIWQAFQNVINSYKVLEFSEQSEHGFRKSASQVPDDLFVRRVLILRATLLPDWRMDPSFQNMDETIRRIMHPLRPGDTEYEDDGTRKEPAQFPTAIECFELYEAIVRLLETKHFLKVKPPWDPAD
jgi:hypothetical protein